MKTVFVLSEIRDPRVYDRREVHGILPYYM